MTLFKIIHHHYIHGSDDDTISQKLDLLTQQNLSIMSALDDLKAEVADLKVKVDEEQAQIQALLDAATTTNQALEAQIVVLEGQLASGATAEQIQEQIDVLKEIKADIEGTVAGVTNPPPTPPVEG